MNAIDKPVLSEDTVYHIIAANPDAVSLESIGHYFGLNSTTAEQLDTIINTLVRGRKIQRAPNTAARFTAVKPMADMAVARVIDRPSRGRANLRIENVNFDLPYPITISDKQVRAHHLKAGERILVLLERHKGFELKAKLIERFNSNRTAPIVGKFSEKSEADTFSPLDKRIRSTFRAVGKLPAKVDGRVPYYAQISATFDPFAPEVTIGEQKWDPRTGSRIYDVIASNHGLRHKHDKATSLEAKRMARKKFDTFSRRDFTQSPILVVDPPNARDHDDGILVERIPGGFYTLAVIADVPLFVQSGSYLDAAARARGFSHYFPDETFHMLPPVLAGNACSLVEGKLRPVIYVEQFRDVNGIPYKTDIGLGYIQSQRQMTYAQFQQYLGSNEERAKAYWELQSVLAIRQHEKEIQMESASTDFRYSDAQLVVQAMMMDANRAVADFLDDRNVPYLRRTHAGHVNPLAYHEIAQEFEALGYQIPASVYDLTPGVINGIIAQGKMRGDYDRINSMVRLRLLEPALYSPRSLGHWGTGSDTYTHFTSPIRRYADIIVQRAVHTALGDDRYGLSREDEENLDQIARNLNHLQIVNRSVQHETTQYYAVMDLHRNENNSVLGNLLSVRPDSIEIFLPAYGLRKMIGLKDMPPGWRVTENGRGITDGALNVLPGAKIRVKITDVQPHRAQWQISKLEATKGHAIPTKIYKKQDLNAVAALVPRVA